MNHTTLPLVRVTWADAWIRAEEPVTLADVAVSHKPLIIHTLGYLLKEDETGISIANEYYDEDLTYRGRTFIPHAMVLTIERQDRTKPRKPRKPREKTVNLPPVLP